MTTQNKGRRLVLHFDINKTVIMKDAYNKSPTIEVQKILSDIVWGKLVMKKVAPDREEQVWQLAHDQLSTNPPPQSGEEGVQLMTYRDYLDQCYPLVKRRECPDEAERDRLNQENHQIRLTKLANFPKPGNPGAKFKNVYEKMIKSLTLPKAAQEELRISADAASEHPGTANMRSNDEPSQDLKEESKLDDDKQGEDDQESADYKRLQNIFYGAKYNLIPSFFRTLIYLKKLKREFAIVFRTFGQDTGDVIFEFNKFCTGNHPCYNGRGGTPLVKFDGSKNNRDLKIQEKYQQGLFYRQGADISKNKLVTGSLKRTSHDDELEEFYSGDIEEGTVNIYREAIEQYVAILEVLKKKSSMAIQDDFDAWYKNKCQRNFGKLLLVDQADYGTQQIFFDDNFDETEDSIIDVRDVVTGEEIPYKRYNNKYVVRVEPHRAILEPDYFIKMIEVAEQEREQEVQFQVFTISNQIERIENGQESDDEIKNTSDENEWDKLQKLPNEEYMMKTILPVLYQGMRVVDLERPAAPLEYLALYLLKHQDQIKLPPKPQQQQ